MKISVEVHKSLEEIEVLIKTAEINDTVNSLVQKLSEETPQLLVGFSDGKVSVIDESCVTRIYSGNKKVFAVTENKEYLIKLPLYEVFNRVNKNQFVRISNAEIINIKKVIEFDLSFSGTICVKLIGGDVSYVSRRYVPEIKQFLGIGGK